MKNNIWLSAIGMDRAAAEPGYSIPE